MIVLLLFAACTHPPPGVLTLAPAGMRTTGSCVTHPDGTLRMPADTTADSTVYVDAGTVSITVTAKAESTEHTPVVEVWLAGNTLGRARVSSTESQPFPFHAQARTSGPTALRISVSSESASPASSQAVVDLGKIVITEP